jgi:hypothetical protein
MALFGGFQERREKKALEHYLTTPSIDATQIEELKKACPDAQAVLYRILRESPDRDKRFRALLGLQVLGITPDMVAAVLDALHDEDDFVQESAAKILATNPQFASVVLPALVALYTEHAAVRPMVLQILAEYGPAARPAAKLLVDGLRRPTEALAVARCLARIAAEDLDPIEQAMVDVLSDRTKADDLARLRPFFQSTLEAFLLSCVPWRCVDAIPAWRRVLEAYAQVCDRPAEPVARLLAELVQYTDWKLRGEVGAQFMEMSRAKTIAEKLVRPQSGSAPA